MKFKLLSIFLIVIVVVLALTSCGKSDVEKAEEQRKSSLKIGLILSGDDTDVYSKLHYDGLTSAVDKIGLKKDKLIVKSKVSEEQCYETAIALVDDGCTLIFAAGDKFEDYIVQAATEKTDVQFCYADGKQSNTNGLKNYHNYGISTFESRYLTGVIAGMKLNEMIKNGEIVDSQAKIGYVGSVAGSQSRSDYTAFFLGVKSVCNGVTMEVQYSGLSNSANLERIAANALMANGCIMIAQQGYLNGAAETCEKNGKYFIGCDSSATDKAPKFSVTSTQIDLTPCYSYAIETYIKDGHLPTSWCNGIKDDAVSFAEINTAAFSSEESAKAAEEKAEQVKSSIKEGKLHIFNTSKWTIDNKKVTSTGTSDFQMLYNGTEYIKDGYFAEGEIVSYPQFDFVIDGIKELNA